MGRKKIRRVLKQKQNIKLWEQRLSIAKSQERRDRLENRIALAKGYIENRG